MHKLIWAAAAAALLATPAAAADAKNGQTVFGRCAICHTVQKGGPNGLGPNLFGVVGRKAASLASFSYSGALKSSGITWTPDKLKQWVMGPQKLVPGTKMAFGGITNTSQADDVVAYLGTLK
ncbi:MAG: cytochrome c family protein [Alphaproteobacteria bacterium]|nr:cytochrome c family protein [Alphaproteobacteria bacterium]MBL6937493.1 cytochrome c family protein [Alphaproteobacteria bacterium]MBL7098831.1 cytochrome c family protein [Alphaproteobacteria bacterium]